MTKEELEKGAKEYCEEKKHYRYIADGIIQDYIAKTKAEPREKRITELEKENAELKEKLEIEKNARGDWFGKAVTKDRRLTEAKEIIKKLLNAYKYVIRFEEYADREVVKEAEQFLKESE